MRVYYSGPDSVGKWAWGGFLETCRPVWPLHFLNTFAQLADWWDGWGKQKWVLRYYRSLMKTSVRKAPAKHAPREATGGLFFLDSGAFSLYAREVLSKKPPPPRETRYAFYEGREFWDYVDAYAAFVKQYADCIDYYANVDVIYNPEKTWEVQRYLEDKHGLRPVPVVHYGTPLKWLEQYIAGGYGYVGIGGLAFSTVSSYRKWLDAVFAVVCPGPSRLPVIRTHGFAMTSYEMLLRYPWWSVDSASWTKSGAFGNILLPHKRKGSFTFETEPYVVSISTDSPTTKEAGKSYHTMSKAEQAVVREWLELIGVPLGKGEVHKEGKLKGKLVDPETGEYGVINRHSERKVANLLFFERLRAWLPAYPWPFAVTRQAGFGLA